MKNETSSREYTRSDFIRAGVVAGVWVLLYALLATVSGGRSVSTVKTATAAAPVSISGEVAAARNTARRPDGNRFRH